MTDDPPAIDLPRFSRHIGVTGLSRAEDGDAEPRPIGVLRPFSGVLATSVSQRRVDGASPQLAYLTLTSLVGNELRDRQAGTSQHDMSGGSPASRRIARRTGESDTALESTDLDGDDTAEELTVRELLRTTAQEWSGSGSGPPDETGLDNVTRDVSTMRTLDRAVRPLNEPTDTTDETSGQSGSAERRAETPVTGFDAESPSRTVVDQPDLEADETATTDSDEPTVRETLGDATSASSESTTADSVGVGEPVGTVVDRAVPRREHGATTSNEGDTFSPGTIETVDDTVAPSLGQPRLTVVNRQSPASGGNQRARSGDASTGEAPTAWERPASSSGESAQRPGLTVRQPHATVQRPETEAKDGHDGRPTQRTEPQSGPGSESTPPTAIAADGSVNDRVLDRLYEELRRKERIERDREGH